MNIINETEKMRIETMIENNIYSRFSFEKQKKIEYSCEVFADSLSKALDKGIVNSKNKRGITVGFKDEMSFGAIALVSEETYLGKIVLKRGTLIQLYDFFAKIDTSDAFISEDKKADISEMFSLFAAQFIIAHEIAHIYHGHITLKNVLLKEKDNLYEKKMQVLEWDADCFAATKMCEWVNSLSKNNLFPELKTKDCIWIILLEAIHGLMYLCCHPNEYVNIEKKEHLPMNIRENLVLKVFINLIKSKYYDSIEKYIAVFEEKLNRVFKISQKDQEKFRQLREEYTKHENEIPEMWDTEIKYALKKYSYLPIEGIDYDDFRNHFKI